MIDAHRATVPAELLDDVRAGLAALMGFSG
jgi:hypothetical protein